MEKNKKRKEIYILIAVLVILVLVISIYFAFNNVSTTAEESNSQLIKNEIVNNENYQQILERAGEELKNNDERYYLTYASMYYVMKDGMAARLSNNTDENAMYVNIYGKTVNKLIEEGKQLMKDNNLTIEKFKEQIEEANGNQ